MGRKKYRNESFSEKYEELFKIYSCTELSDKLKVRRATLSDWESGKSFPDLPDLVKIAELLHVSVDYLLGLTPFNSLDGKIQSASQISGLTENTILAINDEKHDGHIVNLLNKFAQAYDSDGNPKHYLSDVAEELQNALRLTTTDSIDKTAMIGEFDTGLKSRQIMRTYCDEIGKVWSKVVLDYLIDDVIKKNLAKSEEEVK